MTYNTKIREIWFLSAGVYHILRPKEGQSLILKNEYHGEYDIDWVCLMEKGKELSRHNVKFIASIVWGND